MYCENPSQMRIESEQDFVFNVKIRKDNQWVRLANMMDWDYIDDIYRKSLCIDEGRRAYSSRFAFAILFARAYKNLTMDETLELLEENHCFAYFAGAHSFRELPEIDKSTIVDFEKRFPVEELAKINESICLNRRVDEVRNVDRNDVNVANDAAKAQEPDMPVQNTAEEAAMSQSASTTQETAPAQEAPEQQGVPSSQDTSVDEVNRGSNATECPCDTDNSHGESSCTSAPQESADDKTCADEQDGSATSEKQSMAPNRGEIIMDATVASQDIKFPTDFGLLNDAREKLERAIELLWPFVPHVGKKFPYSVKNARRDFLLVSKAKKCGAKKLRKAVGEQLRYVRLALERFQAMRVIASDVKLPSWLEDRLAVIPTVLAQQQKMYDDKSHTIPDRIVSLSQPYVRPIYRGKKPLPTEFGQKLHLSVIDGYTFLEQTSWSNFNEATDLIPTVEAYVKRFGCYPEAVLADEIYRNKKNRDYCKEHGIRLTGKPLGRPKKNPEETKKDKQIAYQDSCKRNAVEGRNGNLKRRYSCGRIMSKLDETSKSEVCLDIIAMNARHHLKREDDAKKAVV